MNWFKKIWEARFVRWWITVRFVGMLLGLGGVAFGVWSYLTVYGGEFNWKTFAADYGANISTSVVTLTLAVLMIDALNERRTKRERKRSVIERIGSPVNEITLDAVRIAIKEGWLYDQSLQRALLWEANLQGAHLVSTDFQGADLTAANLSETRLDVADMRGARLAGANLEKANLSIGKWQRANLAQANLQDADLMGSNFYLANLSGAILKGTNMAATNLRAVDLINAQFDENTILPDGTKWTSDVDLMRFTDRDHPNFWQPDAKWLLDRWEKENMSR